MPLAKDTIHYQTMGDPGAPPLLLIMGLAVSSRAWDRLPELMARRFHVLVFDNRGTGRSVRRGFAYRMRELADDAAAVIEAAGLRSAHVFGISMGGMIAQELALRHPERVRSLALGATIASFRKGRRAPLRSAWDLIALNLGYTAPERLARLLVSADSDARNPAAALKWIRRAEPAGFRIAVAQFLAVARHHTLPRLSQIRAPTLVLTADADRPLPLPPSPLPPQALPPPPPLRP